MPPPPEETAAMHGPHGQRRGIVLTGGRWERWTAGVGCWGGRLRAGSVVVVVVSVVVAWEGDQCDVWDILVLEGK